MTTIATTDSQLHELERIVTIARDGTANVSVPKEALRRLLLDHYTLNQALRERKLLAVTAGADQRSLL